MAPLLSDPISLTFVVEGKMLGGYLSAICVGGHTIYSEIVAGKDAFEARDNIIALFTDKMKRILAPEDYC